MVKRLQTIAAFGIVIMAATIAVVEIGKPPTVYVGKIEKTFVPHEFPPAIWR